jgi:IclR family KDG regulon transcriptional repressor
VLGTVSRAGDLLELFDLQTPEWGATAVSRKLAITKSQAHEMLVSLESIGLLRRAGRGRFRLGWRTVTLSQRLLRSEFTPEDAQIVRRLARCAEAFAELTTFDGSRFVRVAGFGPGERTEIGADRLGASGKVLLASLPEGVLADAFLRPGLEAELSAVRMREVALEEDPERCSVAAPVHGADGIVRAALGLTVPADVWRSRKVVLTRAVTGTAQRLSNACRRREQEPDAEPEPRGSELSNAAAAGAAPA